MSYQAFGVRVGVQPELDFVNSNDTRFSGYTDLSAGLGTSSIVVDGVGNTFSSWASTVGAELGLRFTSGQFTASIGYVHRLMSVDESDTIGNVFVKQADFGFSGFQFSAGIRW
ncbi:MAG: hypothetical protein CMJ85_09450 [Planctomycetes bacterium]|nr:hypothetical protein [Planctomycetota bacterium]